MSTPHTKTPGERYHGLDALRAFAMFLGILLHVAIGYMQNPPFIYVMNKDRSLLFDFHNLAIHSFRMQLFFMVAGFFAHMVFHRSGPGAFILQRLQRIGIPLVIGYFILVPATWILFGYGLTGRWSGALESFQQMAFKNLMHLWFLYYLMIYYFLMVLLQPVFSKSLPGTTWEKLDALFLFVLRSRLKLLYLALPTFFIYFFTEHWADIGLPTSMIPIPRVVFYYFCFFLFGWWLHRNVSGIKLLTNSPYWLAGFAFLLLAALAVLLPMEQDSSRPGYIVIKTTAFIVYNLLTWSAIFALVALFLRWFKDPSERVRYLADASYWCYLAHLPILFIFQVLIVKLNLPAIFGYLICTLLTVVVLAVTYHFFVRYTMVGAVLNGPRKRPGDSKTVQAKLSQKPAEIMEKL